MLLFCFLVVLSIFHDTKTVFRLVLVTRKQLIILCKNRKIWQQWNKKTHTDTMIACSVQNKNADGLRTLSFSPPLYIHYVSSSIHCFSVVNDVIGTAQSKFCDRRTWISNWKLLTDMQWPNNDSKVTKNQSNENWWNMNILCRTFKYKLIGFWSN